MAATLPTPSDNIIYGLIDPRRPWHIRYIGKTKDVSKRLRQHINGVNKLFSHKNSWIKSLLNDGFKPMTVIIERCTDCVWESRERFWIAYHRSFSGLTNTTDGGDRGPDMTGFRHDEHTKILISNSGKGRKWSDDRKVAMRHYMKGRKMPPDIVAKVSDEKRRRAVNGDRSWEAGIVAAIAHNTGRKHSDEWNKKVSMAQLGRRQSTSSLLSTRIPIICVETGTWFPSTADATRRCGFARTSIHQAIRLGTKAGGFHWQKESDTHARNFASAE